jgi:hypothetical protein
MKKIIISFFISVSVLFVFSQNKQSIGSPNTLIWSKGGLKSDSGLITSRRDTLNHPYKDSVGALTVSPQDGFLYYRDINKWNKIKSGNIDTTDISFFSSKVRGLLSSSNSLLTYNNSTGVFGLGFTTTDTARWSNMWSLNGNTGTNPASHFIGTTDNQDVVFRANNVASGRIGITSNTAFGYSANPSNTGTSNTAIGNQSLASNATGSNNASLGLGSLFTNTTGSNNTGIGTISLSSNTTGSNNVAAGYSSLLSNATGNANAAIGVNALSGNTQGSNNTAAGFNSLSSNGSGIHNAGFGNAALTNNTGSYNTALGSLALQSNTIGTNNIALGYNSNANGTTGSYNMTIGSGVNVPSATGSRQLNIGNVLYGTNIYNDASNPSSTPVSGGRIGIGTSNPQQQLDLTENIGLVTSTSTAGNIYKGSSLFIHNFQPSGATGQNTFIGVNSGNLTMTAPNPWNSSRNTAIGYGALTNNTVGFDNVAIGSAALTNSTEGVENVAIGSQALTASTTGAGSIAIGSAALLSNTTGGDNIAIGRGALRLNTTGGENVTIGTQSLYVNTTGQGNTGLGRTSLYNNTIGNYNTGIGYNSLNSNTTGSYNIAIGAGINVPSTTGSRQLNIAGLLYGVNARNNAGTSSSNPVDSGRVGIGLQVPTARLHLPAGTTSASSAPLKFTSGTNLTTPEDGAIEYNGTHFYATIGSTRYQLDQQSGGGGSGTVNSGTANRLVYYASTGTAVSELAAITANRALISDANGLPTHSTVTSTELGYVSGVTSAIQTQLNSRFVNGGNAFAGTAILGTADNNHLDIYTNNTRRLRFFDGGGIGINTISNAGFGIDVNVTSRFQNTVTISNGGAIISNATGSGNDISISNPKNLSGLAIASYYPSTGNTNSNTTLSIIPKGTGVSGNRAQLNVFNTDFIADATNYELWGIRATGTSFVIGTGRNGSGSNRPVILAAGFLTDGTTNANQLYIDPNGNIGLSTNTPSARLHLPAGTSSVSPLKFISGTFNTIAEAGAIEYDGVNFTQTNGTAIRGIFNKTRVSSSSASTLALSASYSDYVFSGTTTTWTLPAVSGNTNVVIFVVNKGSGNITLNSNAGGNDLWEAGATSSSKTILPGEAIKLLNDGTNWNVFN